MNRKQIKEIKIFLEKLNKILGSSVPYDYDLDYSTDEIYVKFPQDDDELNTYHVEEIRTYFDEIDSICIIDDNKVISNTITQRVIEMNRSFYYYIYLGLFENNLENGIKLRIRDSPLLIGIAAVQMKQFDKYNTPCSRHTAVEIIYPSKEMRLSDDDEDKMLTSYFFEIANKFKVSIKYSSFHLKDENDENVENDFLNILKLEDYNFGMDLFIKANNSLSEDLKYLFYYKIFEYFAPIYTKIEAYDLLKKKLDNVNSQNHNSNYLNSFFDLARKYDKSLRDKELIKSLLNNTFDLIDLYHYIPETIRTKKIKTTTISYKTNKESIDRICDILGDILYSTRNQIVHAKSNYNYNGLECHENDLQELNNFMHHASYSLVKWYNRLPDYQK
ncbi:hypothetical protein [Chryseobacterium rhizosphaerae]|uniref:hypothetical protein n=1 Tax=Chryseobacterium rhizosphaerae TaxID=395937 RepID=UPI003D0D6BD8